MVLDVLLPLEQMRDIVLNTERNTGRNDLPARDAPNTPQYRSYFGRQRKTTWKSMPHLAQQGRKVATAITPSVEDPVITEYTPLPVGSSSHGYLFERSPLEPVYSWGTRARVKTLERIRKGKGKIEEELEEQIHRDSSEEIYSG